MQNDALKLALAKETKESFMAGKFEEGINRLMDLARNFGREIHTARATHISERINDLNKTDNDSGIKNLYRKLAIQLIDSIAPTARPNPTIYVSHDQNKKNKYWVEKFLVHFSPIKYYLNIWHPDMTLPGSVREQEFKKEMENAEVLVFLLSADFFENKFCEAQEEYAILLKNTKYIVPVRLVAHIRDEFIGRKYLPEGDKGIKEYGIRFDSICVEIIRKIIELIK